MEWQQQVEFVRELCGTIEDEVVRAIKEGQLPSQWDGHELRVLLAERFSASASMSEIRSNPRGKRARDYKTARSILNV